MKKVFKIRFWNTVSPSYDLRIFFLGDKSLKGMLKILKRAENSQNIHGYEVDRSAFKILRRSALTKKVRGVGNVQI